MKLPQKPPDYSETILRLSEAGELVTVMMHSHPVDGRGRYLHWDDLRRRTPPDGLTQEQWWLSMAVARRNIARALPLRTSAGSEFRFSNVDAVQELVHHIDQQASGQILADDVVTSLKSSDRYLVSSLVEEAITSSQLEGASTTRQVAKEMLQTGRPPKDRSEQMIANNYSAMLLAEELARSGEPLTPTDVLDLHRVVTEGALDDPLDAGRLQTADEERISVRWTDDTLLHLPPPATELERRLEMMCEFANGTLGDGFLHPVVRAIVLHFWLAHDHPFVDGNGRTSRALFYWSMLRSGYWLTQYLSISSILRKAPTQYARSYLLVESDDADITYFVLYQLGVIERAIESLKQYLSRKIAETRELGVLLRGASELNHRQLAILTDAIKDPSEPFTFAAQARRHRVTHQSARTDLLKLEELGLMEKTKSGKKFVFRAVEDLPGRLRDMAK